MGERLCCKQVGGLPLVTGTVAASELRSALAEGIAVVAYLLPVNG